MNWVSRRGAAIRTWCLTRGDRGLFYPAIAIARLIALLWKASAPTDTRVIVRPGGMGDLICAQIALETLGVSPRDFTWLIEERSAVWARHQELSFKVLGRDVLREIGSAELVINTEQLYGLSQAIALLVKAKDGRLCSFDTVRGFSKSSLSVTLDHLGTHQVKSFQDLFIASLGLDVGLVSRQAVRRNGLNHVGLRKLVVCLGGTHARSRRLSAESWISIIERWTDGCQFELVAGPNELCLANSVVTHFGNRCEFRMRSFEATCEVISRASRILAVDGGLVHVASFYGVPVDAIFTSGQVEVWRPTGQGSRIFSNSVACSPCTVFGRTPRCKNKFRCLNQIEKVVLSARQSA